jgi:prevent-host-death family protein
MATTRLSSREFNQDTGRAKRATRRGPVIITERGRPSHVLLTFEDYQRLAGPKGGILELLGQPRGVGDVELDLPDFQDRPRPVDLD